MITKNGFIIINIMHLCPPIRLLVDTNENIRIKHHLVSSILILYNIYKKQEWDNTSVNDKRYKKRDHWSS